jgi:hypothetical protein
MLDWPGIQVFCFSRIDLEGNDFLWRCQWFILRDYVRIFLKRSLRGNESVSRPEEGPHCGPMRYAYWRCPRHVEWVVMYPCSAYINVYMLTLKFRGVSLCCLWFAGSQPHIAVLISYFPSWSLISRWTGWLRRCYYSMNILIAWRMYEMVWNSVLC